MLLKININKNKKESFVIKQRNLKEIQIFSKSLDSSYTKTLIIVFLVITYLFNKFFNSNMITINILLIYHFIVTNTLVNSQETGFFLLLIGQQF